MLGPGASSALVLRPELGRRKQERVGSLPQVREPWGRTLTPITSNFVSAGRVQG